MATWIYPYKTLFGDIAIRLESLRVDGESVPGSCMDGDRREVRLLDVERSDWEVVELDIAMSGPLTELRELQKDGQVPAAVAVAHCGASNTRQAIKLEPAPDNAARWQGSLELQRSNWFGRIDLRGALVAKVDGVADRVIGTPESWVVRLDDIPPPPVNEAIRTLWHDFSYPEEELEWLREYKAEPAFLRLDDEQPTLYLNRSFEGLKALLDPKPKREGGEQALHDQARAAIATEVWAAMFNAAVQAIRQGEEEEAPDWPEETWKRIALEMLLDRLYPAKEAEDALRDLAEQRHDETAGGALQQDLLIAVSEHVGGARLLRGAIGELGKTVREV